ncbi:MAG: CPBP family intramembrane glutamic endopeptidase [Jatrophihabitantaceae bacterium]
MSAAYLPGARRRSSGPGPLPDGAAAIVAFAGPMLVVGGSVLRTRARWQPPPSLLGRLMLGGHVASGAVLEELLWRAPLTVPRSRGAGTVAAGVSAAGFLALHVRRDGRPSVPVHAVTTASWTVAAVLGRRVRWSILSHALYNFLVLSLRRPDGPQPDEARWPPR